MFDIQENLKKLPDEPGVYIHKDKLGNVIYVGKAISLRKRVRQYFQSSKNMDAKVKAMVSNIEEFEYIKCGSEMEALILENNLIKKYMPKYNILLRDDKTYPYIRITNEMWPRIEKTRRIVKDGSKYFGPFTDVAAVTQMVELLNQIYRIKRCATKEFTKTSRPCLNFHIGQCDGVCAGKADRREYMRRVSDAAHFLKGNQKDLLGYLKDEMEKASENLDYENAARYRDYMIAAKALAEKQRVVLSSVKDMDLLMYAGKGHIVQFYIRDGKLSGRETFSLENLGEENYQTVISAFIKQHYGQMTTGPGEILLAHSIDEKELLEGFLSNIWEKKVSITVPQKGEKKAFLEMAKRDTNEMIDNIANKEKNKRERDEKIKSLIGDVIAKSKVAESTKIFIDEETGEVTDLIEDVENRPYRVEAYDISNTNGIENVGAMIVFEGLRPNNKAYRRFKIKTIYGADDYGSMQEMLRRRLSRALCGDESFLPLPDLILVDGGKGHVEAARSVLESLELEISVVGMAKDDGHRTRALVYHPKSSFGNGSFAEEELKNRSMLFSYVGNIQEEVHRFAIEYHRKRRDKKVQQSILDEIKGIGPVKRNALLKEFGSVEGVKKATLDQLVAVTEISEKNAYDIKEFFGHATEVKIEELS